MPDVRVKMLFPARALPLAYVQAGRLADGIARTRQLVEIAPPIYRQRLRVLIGDMECLRGNQDAARKIYQDVWDSVPDAFKKCCGTEADAARDAWLKAAVMGRTYRFDKPSWTAGERPAPDPAVPTVLAFVDVYRGWDVSMAGRLQTTLDRHPGALRNAVVATYSADTGDKQPEGMHERRGRYKQRGVIKLAADARAREIHKNLHYRVPIIGVPPSQLPADLWTGDYDVVLDTATGRTLFVRAPTEDRTVVEALLRSRRR